MGLKNVLAIIFLMLPMGLGILSVLLPEKLIRLRARFQLSIFKWMGMTADRIDRLPFYSDYYGEPYSKRLRRELEDPGTIKGLAGTVRILGGAVTVLFFLGLVLFILAWQAMGG